MEEGDRAVKAVLTQMRQPYPEGSLLMDAPRHRDIQQLITMARDKDEWNIIVNALKLSLE